MQNKHQKKFCCRGPNLQGGRGGSSRLVQKTKFVKGKISGAPLIRWEEQTLEGIFETLWKDSKTNVLVLGWWWMSADF